MPLTNTPGRSPRRWLASAAFLASLCALLCLHLTCGGTDSGTQAPAAGRAVIVLDIDSLRADHLGCYGSDRATSPNIDALAASAARFDWAFAQAPDTGPSQASILSGLYPTTHGMLEPGDRLAEEVVTLAEVAGEAGWTTAAFVDGGFMSEDFGVAQGFGTWDNSRGGGMAAIGPKVVDWIRGHAEESFLLLVHTYDAHPPFSPPEPHREAFTAGLDAPSEGFEPTIERLEEVRAAAAAGTPAPLAANDLEYSKALYDGEIRFIDEWVGKIITALGEVGLAEAATIVVVSDHGQEFQEHATVGHDVLYTTVTRVPLIVRLPGDAHAGAIDKVVETVDLMPTLLDSLGLPIPGAVQGASLMPLIRGEGTPPYVAFGETGNRGGWQYVALSSFHLLLPAEGSAELYDFRQDPLELDDLAGASADRVEVLRQHLETWAAEVASASFATDADQELADDTLEQLKSLGYVQ